MSDHTAPSESEIWRARLDEHYDVWVVETSDGVGTLHVRDGVTGEVVLDGEPVTFTQEPIFGPDIDDIRAWQERAIQVVDGTG